MTKTQTTELSTFVKDKKFYIDLLLLTLPIAFQNIITYAIGFADNIMVSELGEIAVDGIYIANQITTILQRMVVGLSSSMIILAAQYWGKNDLPRVKSVIGIAIKISFAASVLLCAAVFLFPYQILSLFSNVPEVIESGVEYAQIVCFTYILYCMSNILISAMRCVEVVKIGMYVSCITLVMNIALNRLFIFGGLGIPALGVRGAAMATLLSRCVECGVMVWYVFVYDKRLAIRFKELMTSDKGLLADFIKCGLPVTAGSVAWGINLAVQGAIVGRLGEISIAAVSISGNIFNMVSVGMYGAATASSLIIGKTVGSGDIPLVKQYARTLQLVFLGIGVVTGLFIFTTRDLVLLIYSDMAKETLKLASDLLIVLAVMSVGTAYQMASLTGIVRAGGDTTFVLINDQLFVWLVVIPSSLIAAFVFHAPTVVVFMFLKCDQILKCFVAVVKVNRFNWIKKLTR